MISLSLKDFDILSTCAAFINSGSFIYITIFGSITILTAIIIFLFYTITKKRISLFMKSFIVLLAIVGICTIVKYVPFGEGETVHGCGTLTDTGIYYKGIKVMPTDPIPVYRTDVLLIKHKVIY